MSTNSNRAEVDYNIIDYDVKMTTGLHDLGPCRIQDNDEELLRDSLGDILRLREKRPRKERLESIKSHLMDLNMAIIAIAITALFILVMNITYNAIYLDPNPKCYFSDKNDFKDKEKNNGNFCISTDKEDFIFYCCKSNFDLCLEPDCGSKIYRTDNGFPIANMVLSCAFLSVVIFVIMLMTHIIIDFKKIFDNMYWGDWRGHY